MCRRWQNCDLSAHGFSNPLNLGARGEGLCYRGGGAGIHEGKEVGAGAETRERAGEVKAQKGENAMEAWDGPVFRLAKRPLMK